MKTALTSFLALFLCFNAFAQTNFNKLSVGAGYGLTQSFTDVDKNDFAPSAYGTLDYFLTPFLSFGGELQYGKIKASPAANDPVFPKTAKTEGNETGDRGLADLTKEDAPKANKAKTAENK